MDDVRANVITKKCYEELRDKIKEYLIMNKDSFDCSFVQSMIYILCEYIDDLDLPKVQKLKFIDDKLNQDDGWINKASEHIRLSLTNLVFKFYLRDPEEPKYAELIDKISPTKFEF